MIWGTQRSLRESKQLWKEVLGYVLGVGWGNSNLKGNVISQREKKKIKKGETKKPQTHIKTCTD